MSADPSPSTGQRGCWGVALVILGGLIALLSGLCAGGSIIGGVIDVWNGDATIPQALGPVLPFLLVGLPFLAIGIALIVWGLRLQARRQQPQHPEDVR
ncbi:hypothetical protein [Dongia sp.]|uniref:hypothetical protein n=1 Tax=Dongia sp. TaxID=1977262 RepID=UPI003752DCF1